MMNAIADAAVHKVGVMDNLAITLMRFADHLLAPAMHRVLIGHLFITLPSNWLEKGIGKMVNYRRAVAAAINLSIERN